MWKGQGTIRCDTLHHMYHTYMHTQWTLSYIVYTYAAHIIHFTVIEEELLQLVNPVVPLAEQTDL